MGTQQRINALFASIDRKDVRGFSSYLAKNVDFRFGNAPMVSDRETASSAVQQFFESVKALRHTIEETWEQGDQVVCHGTVTYTRHDDSRLSVPFANIFTLREDQISRYLIFADLSDL